MLNTVKLSEIVNIDIGKTPSRNNYKYWDREKKDSNIWVSIRDISALNGIYINDSREYISNDGAKLFKEVPKNTLIMSFKLSIGKLAITKINLRTNEAIAAFKIKNETLVCKEYLYYYLSSLDWDKIAGTDIKVKGKTLNKAKLKEILIVLPTLSEQKRLIVKFDTIFTKINKLIGNIKLQRINLKNLFDKNLIKKFNNKSYTKYELGSICEIIGGSQPPKSNFEYENKNTNIRFIQIRDYKSDNHIVYIPKEKAKRFCNKTDVMIGRYGPPIFQILRGIEGAYNVALMKAVPKKEILNDYLFYFLKNKRIQDYVIDKSIRAAGQSGVNKQALEPYKINLPPIDKQKQIVDNIKILDEKITKLDILLKKRTELNIKLKSSILIQLIENSKAA